MSSSPLSTALVKATIPEVNTSPGPSSLAATICICLRHREPGHAQLDNFEYNCVPALHSPWRAQRCPCPNNVRKAAAGLEIHLPERRSAQNASAPQSCAVFVKSDSCRGVPVD